MFLKWFFCGTDIAQKTKTYCLEAKGKGEDLERDWGFINRLCLILDRETESFPGIFEIQRDVYPEVEETVDDYDFRWLWIFLTFLEDYFVQICFNAGRDWASDRVAGLIRYNPP